MADHPPTVMSRPEPFETRLLESWPADDWKDVTVLLAVSGGPDSVALLCGLSSVLRDGDGRVVAAHFNHRTRGEESDADEAFVGQLCTRMDVPCITASADCHSVLHGPGVESTLRDARYGFLLQTAKELGARYVATAHTADDQAETILHRVIRGTGLSGLAGIPGVRAVDGAVTIIRPMLSLRRAEVLAYLQRIQQPYRVDSSNTALQYTRNRIRHELLPELAAKYNPGVVDALLRLGRLAREAQQAVGQQVNELFADSVSWQGQGAVRIDCSALESCSAYTVRELLIRIWRERGWPLQAMAYRHWTDLGVMVHGASIASFAKRVVFPGDVLAERDGTYLWLQPASPSPSRDS